MIDDRTQHLELPLPHEDNFLQFDVNRLREALSQIDSWLEQVIETAGAALPAAQKGAPNGVAPLDAQGLVPAAHLPSYVDDVLEFSSLNAFPAQGELSKIYVAADTNKTYRWSGSAYVYITSGAVDSVNGQTGVVTLGKAEVGLPNVDNTSDADKPISTATQAALNGKQASLGFTPVQQSGGAGQQGNKIYIGWSGSAVKVQVDGLDYGNLWSTYNFNPASYMPLSGGNFTGNFGIYNTSPTVMFYDTDWGPRQLHCNSGLIGFLNSGGGWACYSQDDGTFIASGNIGAYSDRKHKTDIDTIGNALALVEQLRGVSYTDKRTGERRVGVIAQEVQEVLPEVVGEGPDGLHVDYGNIVGPLIEAVKELAAEVRMLKRGL